MNLPEEMYQMCCDLAPFLKIVKLVISIVQFSVPLVLIGLGTFDMIKAITSGDEKVSKEVAMTFGKRLLFGVVIFLVPYLLKLILQFTEQVLTSDSNFEYENGSATAWLSCWNNIEEDEFCSNRNIYTTEE